MPSFVASFRKPAVTRVPSIADFLSGPGRRAVHFHMSGLDCNRDEVTCYLNFRNLRDAEINVNATGNGDAAAFWAALVKAHFESVNILPGWPMADVQRWLATQGVISHA
jgi:hypothetical protein